MAEEEKTNQSHSRDQSIPTDRGKSVYQSQTRHAGNSPVHRRLSHWHQLRQLTGCSQSHDTPDSTDTRPVDKHHAQNSSDLGNLLLHITQRRQTRNKMLTS